MTQDADGLRSASVQFIIEAVSNFVISVTSISINSTDRKHLRIVKIVNLKQVKFIKSFLQLSFLQHWRRTLLLSCPDQDPDAHVN